MHRYLITVCAAAALLSADAFAQKSTAGAVLSNGHGINVTRPIVSPPSTEAVSAIISVAGIDSWDTLHSANNVLMTDPTGGTGANFSAVSWDVTIVAPSPSWLSEARIYFDGSDLDDSGLFLTPGFADTFPGTGTYSSGGVVDLTDNGIPDVPVLADGLLHMEFYEGYDDFPGAVDNTWSAGNITVYYDSNCGSVTSFGTACPGNGGFTPNFELVGCPQVGVHSTVNVTNCEGGAPWFMVFSAGSGSINLPSGCTLDLATPFYPFYLGNMPGVGPGNGQISFPVVHPNAGSFYLQVVVKDSVAGLITSNGLNVVVNP